MKYKATVDGTDFTIDVERHGEVVVDGVPRSVDLRPIDGGSMFSLIMDHRSYDLHVERRAGMTYVVVDGNRFAVDVGDARLKELIAMSRRTHDEASGAVVEAPMPGMVVKVMVAAGDVVAEDEGLLILEAMKMENEIRSPTAGVVERIAVEPGTAVNLGDVLVVIQPPDHSEGGDAAAPAAPSPAA